jgi:hypothetical protein
VELEMTDYLKREEDVLRAIQDEATRWEEGTPLDMIAGGLIDAIAAIPDVSLQGPISEEREALICFLRGVGTLDGVWFGEPHPIERGAFWWRKYLPLLRAPQQQAEPVAWAIYWNDKTLKDAGLSYLSSTQPINIHEDQYIVPLYATPPPAQQAEPMPHDMTTARRAWVRSLGLENAGMPDDDALEAYARGFKDATTSLKQQQTEPVAWLVWYQDPDRKSVIFSGHGARVAARSFYESAKMNWNCVLFGSAETSPATAAPPPDDGDRISRAVVLAMQERHREQLARVGRLLQPAYDALDRIGNTANEQLETARRSDAKIVCFYAVQQLRSFLSRKDQR